MHKERASITKRRWGPRIRSKGRQQGGKATHLDLSKEGTREDGPQHRPFLHLKAVQTHGHALKVGHVERPRQNAQPSCPGGAGIWVSAEAAQEPNKTIVSDRSV
jgi:hypothetical protein